MPQSTTTDTQQPKMSNLKITLLSIAIFAVIITIVTAIALAASGDSSKDEQLKTSFSNGFFVAGKDIEEGTYRVSANGGCFYTTYNGSSASSKDVKDSESITSGTKDLAVFIGDGDSIDVTGCGTWTK